ncbi:4Fe-4S dicluster domain-containing protein [Chloroflexota bacterium]
MRKVYAREDVCMGCGLCRVYCQTAHSKTKDVLKAFKKEGPRPLPRLRVEKNGEVCFSIQCRHCDEPMCAYSCLTGASHKDHVTGKVIVDPEKCIGCWTCVVACPNGALIRDTDSHVVVKCDLCPEEEIPACVANCPNEALVLGRDDKEEKLAAKS